MLLNEGPPSGDSTYYVIMMWENDADACEFPSSDGRPPRVESTNALESFVYGLGGPLALVSSFTQWSLEPLADWVAGVPVLWQKDDPVGVVEIPSCFAADSGAERLWLKNASESTGWVDVDFRGDSRQPICEDPPPPPPPSPPSFSVSVTGPTEVAENMECLWSGAASAGTQPYSYIWYRDGNQAGSTSEYYADTGTSSFTLWLYAFDSAWGFAADTVEVSVTQEQIFCPT